MVQNVLHRSWSFYFLKWVFAQNASLDGRSHLNWSSFDTLSIFLVSRSSSSFSELEEWEDNEVEDELKDRELRLFVMLLTSLFRLGKERDRRRRFATLFPCLPFLVRFAPCWARILLDNSSLFFYPRGLSSSFSWSLLLLITFLRLTLAIFWLLLNECVKSWNRELVVHFYIAMTLGKCSIWLKQRFYEIKFIFYNQIYLHKIIASCVLLMFVFDLIWSSSKMLSSVNFSSESASGVKLFDYGSFMSYSFSRSYLFSSKFCIKYGKLPLKKCICDFYKIKLGTYCFWESDWYTKK